MVLGVDPLVREDDFAVADDVRVPEHAVDGVAEDVLLAVRIVRARDRAVGVREQLDRQRVLIAEGCEVLDRVVADAEHVDTA